MLDFGSPSQMPFPAARRIGWAVLALLGFFILHAAWRLAAPVPWVRLVAITAVLLAALKPRDALLVLAGVGPVIGVVGASAQVPYSLRELLVVSLLTGWACRAALRRRAYPALPADLASPILVVILLIAASAVVEFHGQRTLLGAPEFDAVWRRTLDHGFLIDRHGVRGLNAAAVYLEGIAIFAASAALCAGRPMVAGRVGAMAAAGAAGAALLNIQRVINAAVAADAPWQRLRELVMSIRVSIQFGDVNAAGSYFALLFFPAGERALHRRGLVRLGWSVVVAAIFAGAWLTGSRAAVAAILGVSLLLVALAARKGVWRGRRLLLAMGICVAAAVLFVAAFPNRVVGAAASTAVSVRVQLAQVGLQMLAQQPLFGVGVGGFFDASEPLLAASALGQLYYVKENAHNNVLQILAELGLIGFTAFCWLFYRVIRRMRGALDSPDRGVVMAMAAGLAAFGLTALLGHPLLVADVNQVFWLILGAAACGTQPAAAARPSGLQRYGIWLVAAVLLATLPWRSRAEVARLDMEHVRHGVSRWTTAPDGAPYQTFTGTATLYVPADVRAVDIPLRLADGANPRTLEIVLGDQVADRIVVNSTTWQVYRLILGQRRDGPRFLPVRLRPVDGTADGVWIGRLVPR